MDTTEKLGLRLPELTDAADVADINYNSQILDEEISKRIKRVNGEEVDEDGAVQINEVPFARQIVSDIGQQSSDAYTARTTGGDASLSNGDATLVAVFGRRTHEGYTPESLQMSVTPAARPGGAEPITAEIDKDTFTDYVSESGTIVLSYTDAWSANPTLYGVTVTGTPISGDVITIVYVKEDRGLIRVSTPTALRSTGWNLYNHSEGNARVVRYSDTYGFIIGGSYTGVQFSETLDGSRTSLPVSGGRITVPSDGYVWVTGGDAESTYVLMTWSDWTDGYGGEFQAYTESEIDLTGAMADFPYGLMQVGGVSDEIDLSMQQSISRIERLGYSEATLEAVKASGREYEYDRSYIYVVREAPVTRAIGLEQTYTVSDHGMEFIDGTEVAPLVQSLYGQNLVDKLRQEVVAVTPQSFSATQKSRARQNIGAAEDGAVIKTINHKYPDSYGDITIIEGAGDAELGSYRVNVTIPVSAWVTADGVYTATYSDPLIAANMDGVETWLDDPSAMLGATTFSTEDGVLTVTTAVKPTAPWGLHVVLATNGANVLSIANVKANKATVAYVEDEDTAYHNIAIGDYVIWKEELYTATNAIAVGATISGKVTRVEGGGLNALKESVFGKTPNKLFSTAVNAEEALATMPTDEQWFVTFSDGAYTGELRNLLEGVCYVVQFAMAETSRIQIAFSAGAFNRVYWRRRNWWSTEWGSWQRICSDAVTTGTITRASNITSGGTLDMMVCRKVGDIVTVSARLWDISEVSLGNFFQIPAGFRPSYEIWANGYVSITNDNIGAKPAGFRISSNGLVYVGYSSSMTTNQVFFSATYHV